LAVCSLGSCTPQRRKTPKRKTEQQRYYGCGSPFPQGIAGKRVLDLGCGTGRDCYVCAALVGASGSVTGERFMSSLCAALRHAGHIQKEAAAAPQNTSHTTKPPNNETKPNTTKYNNKTKTTKKAST
jgi:SAM-dependent methyltransferase